MTTEVRWFTSEMAGVSPLMHDNGSLIDVLNACLIDGFSLESVDSITRVGATCTATIASGHPYLLHQVIKIDGAVETDYNGDWAITAVTANTFDFEIIGSPSTPATGTITSLVAPVGGWIKEYEDVPSFKVVYKSSEVGGSGYKFRFHEDGSSNNALVTRFEAYSVMTDIDTGAMEADAVIMKSYNASTTYDDKGHWVIVADKRYVHVYTHHGNRDITTGDLPYSAQGFGDIHSYLEGDNHGVLLNGPIGTNTVSHSRCLPQFFSLARRANQVTKEYLGIGCLSRAYPAVMGANSPIGAYNPVDGSIYLEKLYIAEGNPNLVRGEVPGTYFISDRVLENHISSSIIEGAGDHAGKLFVLLLAGSGQSTQAITSSNTAYAVAIQINGDWRV